MNVPGLIQSNAKLSVSTVQRQRQVFTKRVGMLAFLLVFHWIFYHLISKTAKQKYLMRFCSKQAH